MSKARKLKASDVTFTITALEEDLPIIGNASAIDDETDRQTEEWIRNELAQGNGWAWCCVRVTAKFGSLEGHDYLGACSYKSEADFRASGGYFADMCEASLADLQSKVDAIVNIVC